MLFSLSSVKSLINYENKSSPKSKILIAANNYDNYITISWIPRGKVILKGTRKWKNWQMKQQIINKEGYTYNTVLMKTFLGLLILQLKRNCHKNG